jgi:hypothetical protein
MEGDMNDPMNTLGRWPVIRPGQIIRYDFVNRRPEVAAESFVDDMQLTGPIARTGVFYGDPDRPGIPLETLLVAVVLAGVIVAGVGYMVSVGSVDVWSGLRFAACFIGGFVVRLMLETK